MEAEPTSLDPGKRFSQRYRIIRQLGEGANGSVYHVLDEHLNKEVALKILLPKPNEVLTWDEAEMLELLRSKFLLEVFNADIDSSTDLRYIATALMNGGDLERESSPSGIAPTRVIKFGTDVANGLHKIHASGLLHRDIKPANIFLNSSGDALLGDLGMAVKLDVDGTAPANGTAVTAAPEIWEGSRCSIASDIHSLAATLFFALTGNYPYGTKMEDIIHAAKNGMSVGLRDFAPYVTQSLAGVIDRGMSRDPERRQKSALVFANELSKAKCYRRSYVQIRPHDGHAWCSLGQFHGKKDIHICVRQRESFYDIEVRRTSGAHIRKYEEHNLQQSQVSSTLRKVFAVL